MNTKRHSAGPTSIPDAERWGSVHWSAPGNSLEFGSASTSKFTLLEQNEREIDAALKGSAALRQFILKKTFAALHMPWTAYPVERPHQREKLEREYLDFWK